jgi:hypothetical protein
MSEDLLEPTPRGRRNLILLCIGAVAVAFALKIWLMPTLFGYINSLPVCDQLPWWRAVLISTVALLPLAAVQSTLYARKLIKSGQNPPPGTWVFRRTPIKRGRMVRVQAYAILLAAALMLVLTWYSAHQLKRLPFFVPMKQCEKVERFTRLP